MQTLLHIWTPDATKCSRVVFFQAQHLTFANSMALWGAPGGEVRQCCMILKLLRREYCTLRRRLLGLSGAPNLAFMDAKVAILLAKLAVWGANLIILGSLGEACGSLGEPSAIFWRSLGSPVGPSADPEGGTWVDQAKHRIPDHSMEHPRPFGPVFFFARP